MIPFKWIVLTTFHLRFCCVHFICNSNRDFDIFRMYYIHVTHQEMLIILNFAEQEITEEHPAEVCPSPCPGTSPSWCTSQHPEACSGTVQQSPATWLKGSTSLCHKWRSEENPGHQGRTRHSSCRVHQHNQQLLSRRNCQVSVRECRQLNVRKHNNVQTEMKFCRWWI